MRREALTPGQSAALGWAHTFPRFLWPHAGWEGGGQSSWEKILPEKGGHSAVLMAKAMRLAENTASPSTSRSEGCQVRLGGPQSPTDAGRLFHR